MEAQPEQANQPKPPAWQTLILDTHWEGASPAALAESSRPSFEAPGQVQLDDFAANCPEKSSDSRGRPLIGGIDRIGRLIAGANYHFSDSSGPADVEHTLIEGRSADDTSVPGGYPMIQAAADAWLENRS